MADHSSLLADFVNITAVDEERAKFYLESSNWQLEVRFFINNFTIDTN